MENALQTHSNEAWSEFGWHLNQLNLAEWAAIWSPIAEMRAVHPRRPDGLNFGSSRVLGSIGGARYACGQQLFEHGRRQVALSAGVVSIQRLKSGYAAMEFELRSFIHRPGYLMIIDTMQEFRGSQHNAVGEGVFIPRALLGLQGEGPIEPIMISEQSLQGEVLRAEIQKYFATAASETYDGGALAAATNAIISRHRHPASERAGWWQARNELIRKYIDSNLGDSSLLPAQICNMFNLSRATLYRMFEIDGGVRRYIQDRRLHCAIWDLADRGVQRGRLTEVAEKWGFSSNANFNRAVKAVFGMPPGALFQARARPIPVRLEHRREAFPVYDWFFKIRREAQPVSWHDRGWQRSL